MKNVLFLSCLILLLSCTMNNTNKLHRVIVSTDIGGSDPDDFQSMVHLFLYADTLNIEGLISSPPFEGRSEHINEVIKAYETDYVNLLKHSDNYPTPAYLQEITKQGATEPQSDSIPDQPSEGADWIISKALEKNVNPLYILVWGSITDVAQAVHQQPNIKKYIRVYSIGSWNTRQDEKARDYLYNHHPDLWWIENNTTFRGMYMGGFQEDDFDNLGFVETHVKNHGALGDLFWQKKKDIKMGDTPSVLYLLNGNPDDPEGESWGGSFVKTGHGEHYWTDNTSDSLEFNNRDGAVTVHKHRKSYLQDWAKRMDWTLEQ